MGGPARVIALLLLAAASGRTADKPGSQIEFDSVTETKSFFEQWRTTLQTTGPESATPEATLNHALFHSTFLGSTPAFPTVGEAVKHYRQEFATSYLAPFQDDMRRNPNTAKKYQAIGDQLDRGLASAGRRLSLSAYQSRILAGGLCRVGYLAVYQRGFLYIDTWLVRFGKGWQMPSARFRFDPERGIGLNASAAEQEALQLRILAAIPEGMTPVETSAP